jgi:DNA invertase Pin-like site-specific DNA recombinase
MMASVLATFAQFERKLIGQRTKDALAVKKANGVRLGRPREISPETVKRIEELHERGLGAAAIARKLNEEGLASRRSLASRRYHEGALLGSFVMDTNYSETNESGPDACPD